MNIIDLDKLEGKMLQSDGGYIGCCPACLENGRNALSKNHLRVFASGKFNCIVDDSKEHNGRILQLIGTESNEETIAQIPEPKITLPESWDLNILKGLIKNHDYFNSRGISNKTCEKFQMGVALKGQMRSRAVLPIFNEQRDKIIGFTGRKLNNDGYGPKWRHLGNKSLWIFGGDLTSIECSRTVIITEGPADILYLSECGINNTLCLFGVEISSKLLSYLIRINPNRILISTNNEVENFSIGNKAAERIRSKLLQFFNEDKIEIALPQKKDFNMMDTNEIEEFRKKFNI